MKSLTRDIVFTLSFKMILLVLLWYFCVRGMHPDLSSNKEWLLGKEEQTVLTPNNKR
ncbi:TPA: cytochrome oxidase putative small subunit CydP [Legionella pneumophila]